MAFRAGQAEPKRGRGRILSCIPEICNDVSHPYGNDGKRFAFPTFPQDQLQLRIPAVTTSWLTT